MEALYYARLGGAGGERRGGRFEQPCWARHEELIPELMKLPPRVVSEFIQEISRRAPMSDPELLDLIRRYLAIEGSALVVSGGDTFPPRVVRLVKDEEGDQ